MVRLRTRAGACSEALTHLPYELLDSFVDGIATEVELVGDALRLLCQSHAACRVSAYFLVEGACSTDGLRGSGTDGRLFVEGIAVRGLGVCGFPAGLVWCEAQELVRKPRG